ncbi:MAG: hypothetical protein C0524_10460 [Rhodobacter sp.]|nr:hypothetical protein [Rhodobacter sp.]
MTCTAGSRRCAIDSTMYVDAANAYDFGPGLADVAAEYRAKIAQSTAMTDGRITRKLGAFSSGPPPELWEGPCPSPTVG